MLKRITLPDFSPDTPLGAWYGSNLIALPNGYRPALSFSPIFPALVGILGAGAFVSSTGTIAILAGTATNLYHYTGTAWESVLGGLDASIWRFEQFGDNVICSNGGARITYDIAAGTAALTGGSPPSGDLAATVRNQVFLAGDPDYLNNLTIGGYNSIIDWTGNDDLQLSNPFPSGGSIMGLVGGETGLIIQERAIKRATFTGESTVIWQFDEISHDIGCMAKGSVAQAGQLVFFLSEQGFKMCDRNEVYPIGQEVIDRTFFSAYSRQEIVENIRASVDPKETTVAWSMPGTPGAIYRYNYALKKWSPPLVVNVSAIFPGFSEGYTLESLDALFPGGLETIPISLDASKWAGGAPAFYVADQDGVIGVQTDTNLAGSFTIQPMEIEQGRRVRIRQCRMVGDMIDGSVTLDCRARAGDAPSVVKSGAIRPDGRVPIRANGRHIGIQVDIPAGAVWSYLLGVDLEYEIEGER